MNINYTIPNDLHRALKIQAAREGLTLKELITQWLNDHLEQVDPLWRTR